MLLTRSPKLQRRGGRAKFACRERDSGTRPRRLAAAVNVAEAASFPGGPMVTRSGSILNYDPVTVDLDGLRTTSLDFDFRHSLLGDTAPFR